MSTETLCKAKSVCVRVLLIFVLFILVVGICLVVWGIVLGAQARHEPDPNEAKVLQMAKRSIPKREKQHAGNEGFTNMLNDNFKGYRVGDAYKHAAWPICMQYFTMLPLWHRRRFPGTIASDITIKGRWMRDRVRMNEIVTAHAPKYREKFRRKLAEGSMLVDNIGRGGLKLEDCFDTSKGVIASTQPGVAIVHIRIGDVLTQNFRMNMTGIDSDRYKDVAQKLKALGIKKVVLIGGVHITPITSDISGSVAYARDVAKHLEDGAGAASVMMSSEPDMDLCILVEAEVLVAHPKSGFSRIAVDVRKLRALDWQTTIEIKR